MNALNIGDSGFRLIRKSRIVQKSEATMAGSSPKQLYVSNSNHSGISFVNEQLNFYISFKFIFKRKINFI